MQKNTSKYFLTAAVYAIILFQRVKTMKKTLVSHSAAQTEQIGELLAALLHRGDVVAFFGGLGAGKTAFVRGLARGLGVAGSVSSPTFSIVNVYPGSPMLCHFDMYRIDGWDDLCTTGFFDYAEDDAVLAVEWSENIEAVLPEHSIFVTIEPGETQTQRIITLEGDERLENLGD